MIRRRLAAFLRSIADFLVPPAPSDLRFDAREQTLVFHARHNTMFTEGFQEHLISPGEVLYIQLIGSDDEPRSLH